MSATGVRTLELVMPVHNEAAVLPELIKRVDEAAQRLPPGVVLRMLFVDDRSTDGSWDLLSSLAATRNDVRVLRLAANAGHQGALTCGIDHAEGDAVVLMDADLQDDPAAIPLLAQAWVGGSPLVLVQRGRRGEGLLFRAAQALFYRVYVAMADGKVPARVGTFSLLDRACLLRLRAYPERARYLPGIVTRLHADRTLITVDRLARFAGDSKVGLKGQARLALDAILSFSAGPLNILFYLGTALLALLGGGAVAVSAIRAFTDLAIPGWASTLSAILFLGGLQLFSTGLVGAYVARVFAEVKQRPLYHVEETRPAPRPPE